MDVLSNQFCINYETNASGSYLELKPTTSQKIYRHQLEILTDNNHVNMLPIIVHKRDGNLHIFYNITSKQKLSQIIERRRLKRLEFANILMDICKTVIQSSNYLLFEDNFIIDEEAIYVNPSSLKISLLYIPVKLEKNSFNTSFVRLVNKLIIHIDANDGVNDGFIQRILVQLDRESFNIGWFLKFLKEIRLTEGNRVEVRDNKSTDEIIDKNSKASNSKPIKKDIITTKTEDTSAAANNEGANEMELHIKRNTLILFLIQLILLSLVAFMFIEANILINEEGLFDFTALIGTILVIGALDYLLITKILKKVKGENEAKDVVNNTVDKDKGKMGIKELNLINMNKQEISTFSSESYILDENLIGDSLCDSIDTMIIGIDEKQALLTSVRNGIAEKIPINNESFIIGKLADHVDYVISSRGVSRIHAEIFLDNNQYYVKDLNSKNGTFVNGQQIISNQPYEIKDNDTISFADREFVFTMAACELQV
ncbi:FHA domain-containing protein [Alkaliphilus pronyensis]|uniref:FHA domain-containing protein n=1 Tax=Alkaliphilus pronyensis TaxID=1482732 RepID=A0A6I0FDB9_9FIRM|nr:DUF6382 domain-containing protein [Alkaliphilus pronyensis]KAB3537236.1 FHA domain-containing protein [Alkaliphilus pronyensis]